MKKDILENVSNVVIHVQVVVRLRQNLSDTLYEIGVKKVVIGSSGIGIYLCK